MRRIATALAICVAVAGCDRLTSSPRPEFRSPEPVAITPSERSQELAAFYAGVERSLLGEGLLRRDGGGPDTPFNARMLSENFTQIALFNELTLVGGRYVAQESPGRLRRWTKPVSVKVEFGAAVSPQIRTRDLPNIDRYLARLKRVTGSDLSRASTAEAANFYVAVLTVDELDAFAPRLMELVPGLQPSIAQQIIDMPRPTYCAVYTFSRPETPDAFETAIAIIRAEHPDLLRDSCYHEEIAQGLGLSNDSDRARPSIFNDDNEFALLTRHDELLLRMLYDPRLPLGVTPGEARPTINTIARELLGGES